MLKSRIQSIIWFFIVIFMYIFLDAYFALFLLIMSIIIFIFLAMSVRLFINNVELKLIGPSTMPKNKSGNFNIEAINKSILPISKLKCTISLKNIMTGEVSEEIIYISLGSRKKENINWSLSSEHCGKVEIELHELTSYDYLGVFTNTTKPDESVDVLVLPDTFNVNVDILESRMESLDSPVYSNAYNGIDNTDIFGIREYLPGDNFKNIHWKLTSKFDDLIVKELSSTIENSIILIFETSISGPCVEEPSVSDAMVEAFISVSKSLVENEQVHTICWLDHQADNLLLKQINSMEDLANLVKDILELGKKENINSTINRYFRTIGESAFSHILYITSQDFREYSQEQMDRNNVTVLQCINEDQKQENMAGNHGIVFTPNNIHEKLYQFAI